MAIAARGVGALRIYLGMIKIEHSIFALPFAMLGMVWAAHGWPGFPTFAWIVLAMVSCRSAAMAFNRIADRNIDAANPRTRMRAIPAGLLQLRDANLFLFASIAIFFLSSAMLNLLAFALSPIALGITLLYSLAKRVTPLSHFILGLSLGIAPAAAWVAVTGSIAWTIVPITAGVLFWTAGFDIIYSLQDEDFDRSHNLRSLPETVGKSRGLFLSRMCHLLAVLCLILGGFVYGAGSLYYAGVGTAAVLLAYEQSLVSPHDLSKVDVAFFTLNGFVSIGVFLFALADIALRRT